MKKTVFFSILVLALIVAHKQATAQIWRWAKSAGGTSDDVGNSVSTDAAGNVYVTGTLKSSSITFGTVTLTNTGGNDIFLVKYDRLGNVRWAKSAGGTGNDIGYSVCTDASGNVYVTGSFYSSSIAFGADTLNRAGNGADIFLVKYDASGNIMWAKSAGGTADDFSKSISTDASGNVYITGYFSSSSVTFGADTLSRTGADEIFLVKYDSSGKVLWAKSAGGTGGDKAGCVCTDASGNVYVGGSFSSASILFGTDTLTGTGGDDIFLVKCDTSGKVLWAKSAGGTADDIGVSISTDASGNVFIAGTFSSSSILFGTDTLTNTGGDDIFLVKYDPSGKVLWAKSAAGTDYDFASGVSTDTLGNAYVAGSFSSSSITFGKITLRNAGHSPIDDIFLAKYDTSGNVGWAKSAGAIYWDEGKGVSTDAMGNVYVTGSFFSDSITFATDTLSGAGRDDVFLAKIFSCNNTFSSLSATACGRYAWNGKTYTVSGTYIDTIPNAGGCDSIMTLKLTINTPPTVTLILNPDTVCINTGAYTLSGGSPAGGTYSGPGITAGKFYPSAAGLGVHTITYAYTDGNSCADSMNAQKVVAKCTGIETAPGFRSFVIYPNPFSGEAVLQSGQLLQNATLSLENCLGQTVKQIKDINGQTVVLSRGNLPDGLYFVRLMQDNKVIATQKVFITD